MKNPEPELANNECVVLVHGLWRSRLAMQPLEAYLLQQGYATVNVDYPSTRLPLAELAEDYLQPAIQQCAESVAGSVHVVSHSLGGIVTRVGLEEATLPRDGHVVMLSPPNQGSELVDQFHDWPLFSLLAGPAAKSLAQNETLLDRLKPMKVRTGIITGSQNRSWIPCVELSEPHDGTVSVASAKLTGMADFLVVGENHVSIRRNKFVMTQVLAFLKYGHFYKTPVTATPGHHLSI